MRRWIVDRCFVCILCVPGISALDDAGLSDVR